MMQVVLVIGAVQTLFFAILLLNKKGKRLPDKILSFWLIIFTVHLSYIYFLFHKGYTTYFEYGGYDAGIVILYYSIMYIYAQSIIANDNTFRVRWLIHLIPAGVIYASMMPYLLLSYDEKMLLFEKSLSKSLFLNITAAAVLTFITFYMVIIFRLLNKHRVDIRKTFSFEENINLIWLRNLSVILAVIWVFYLFTISYIYYQENTSESGSLEDYTKFEFYGYCLFVGFIYLLGYFGYKQGNIFSYQQVMRTNEDKLVPNRITVKNNYRESKGIKSGTDNEEQAFVAQLNNSMVERKLYMDSKLSLFQLASELDVSTHYLSNVLNNHLHKNFYEYVNHFRIDEVKRRIISNSNSNYTLLAIALDCGFNSKATFNRIFKNYTGYTPKQFQKEYKQT